MSYRNKVSNLEMALDVCYCMDSLSASEKVCTAKSSKVLIVRQVKAVRHGRRLCLTTLVRPMPRSSQSEGAHPPELGFTLSTELVPACTGNSPYPCKRSPS